MKTPEKEIPWHEAPTGATHYAPESSDWLESWYKLVDGEWYGVNTYNAYRVSEVGLGVWEHYGKTLQRPMADLVEREVSTLSV